MPRNNSAARREERKAAATARLAAPQDAQAVAIREAARGYPAKWDAIIAAQAVGDTP